MASGEDNSEWKNMTEQERIQLEERLKNMTAQEKSYNPALKVSAVKPQSEDLIMITSYREDGEAVIEMLGINTCMTTSFHFSTLQHATNTIEFVRNLMTIMNDQQITFYTSISAEPRLQLGKFVCQMKFPERITVMRNIHPGLTGATEMTMLNTKDIKWRRECEGLMGYSGYGSHTQFGGIFKEALVCACLSKRCFRLLASIMAKHGELYVPFNQSMVKEVPGMKDEEYLFTNLTQVHEGLISMKQMNINLADCKKTTRELNMPDSEHTTRLQTEIVQLRAELDKKDRTIQSLESKLEGMQRNNDIYSLEEPPRINRRCRYSRPVYAPSDSDEDSDEDSTSGNSILRPITTSLASTISTPTYNQSPAVSTTSFSPTFSSPDINFSPTSSTPQNSPTRSNSLSLFSYTSLTSSPPKDSSTPRMTATAISTERPARSTRRAQFPKVLFSVGEMVLAKFTQHSRTSSYEEWSAGKILDVLLSGKMLRIQFEDGCTRTLHTTDVKKIVSE